MKKTIRTILCIAAFALLAVSCQKEIDKVELVASTRETIEISINGLMGEYTQVDATKAELVNNVRVSWKGGETVYVYDGIQCLGSLVASLDGTEDRYALLSTDTDHTVKAPAPGTEKLTLVYSPLLTEAPAVSEGAISISLADQSGSKAPFVAYATLDYNNEESITNALAPFTFATSVIKVNCTGLKANTAIDNAKLSNVNTACKLTLSGTAAPSVAGDAIGTITRTGDTYFAADKVNSEGEAVFQIAVPVLTAGYRCLTIMQGSTIRDDTCSSQSALNAATSVNTVCQLTYSSLPGKFSVADGKQVYFSKGNLWADTTDPKNPVFSFEARQYDFPNSWDESHVGHFHWSKNSSVAFAESYKDNGTNTDVFFTNATPETANSDFTVNDVTGKFRALSSAEWVYLFDHHSYKWVTINGIGGYVIAPDGVALSADTYTEDDLNNDGLVFIPAAACRFESSFTSGSGFGYYWTSTAHEDAQADRFAYAIHFSDYSYRNEGYSRDQGFSVRLVIDVK